MHLHQVLSFAYLCTLVWVFVGGMLWHTLLGVSNALDLHNFWGCHSVANALTNDQHKAKPSLSIKSKEIVARYKGVSGNLESRLTSTPQFRYWGLDPVVLLSINFGEPPSDTLHVGTRTGPQILRH